MGGGGDVASLPTEALRTEVVRCSCLRDPAHTGRERFPVPLHLAECDREAVSGMHPAPELLAPVSGSYDSDPIGDLTGRRLAARPGAPAR